MKNYLNTRFFFLSLLSSAPVLMQMQTPGVYEESSIIALPPLNEVESAVPAFIGYTEKASQSQPDDLFFIPKRISSLQEFERHYGFAGPRQNDVLYHSMKLYFANGGSSCFIVSIGNYNRIPGKNDFFKGLDLIRQKDEPTILLFPDAANLPGKELYEVQKAALQQAADLEDRFCILDIKYATTHAAHQANVNEFRTSIGNENLKYGAVYSPWLKMGVPGQIITPPSAAVAGQYCSVDRTRGVWKAPANVSLNMVSEVMYTINSREQEGLNNDLSSGKSVNAIRPFPGKGIQIWGARTLAGNDNEWRYVPVRRFFLMVEESVKKACLPFSLEANDAGTWTKVQSMIENYLVLKWRQGALQGIKPEQAFFVSTGLGKTMTLLDIQEGRMIIEIGMATIRPAEFIILRFSQKMNAL